MIAKFLILATVALACVESGVVPAAYSLPYAVAPFASSYNAHYVNHAVATPVAAPLVAHTPLAAPLVAHTPIAAPLIARAPAPYYAHAAYTGAYPAAYSAYTGAYPAAYSAYPAPLIAG